MAKKVIEVPNEKFMRICAGTKGDVCRADDDIPVYYTYKENWIDGVKRTFWYTFLEFPKDECEGSFDVRTFLKKNIKHGWSQLTMREIEDRATHKGLIQDAYDAGMLIPPRGDNDE